MSEDKKTSQPDRIGIFILFLFIEKKFELKEISKNREYGTILRTIL